jgi:hypothetical protein
LGVLGARKTVIAVALRASPTISGFFFELGNGGNIELREIFSYLVRHRFFHARSSGSWRISHTLD